MILPPTVTILLGLPNVAAQAVSGFFSLLTNQPTKGGSLFIDMQAQQFSVDKHRYIVEHQIPGREGGKLQDLGSACAVIGIQGKWIYENRPDADILDVLPLLRLFQFQGSVGWNWIRVQMMNAIYHMKEPLYIASDLITTPVLIEDLHFDQEGGLPNVYNYRMVLREMSPLLTVGGAIGLPVIQQVLQFSTGNAEGLGH